MDSLGSRFLALLLLSLPIYWLLLRSIKHRTLFLAALSLAFVALLHPRFAVAAIAAMGAVQLALARDAFWAAVLGCVALLIAAKLPGSPWMVPLGVSYFVFRLIAYAADRRRGLASAAGPAELATFLLFFPTYAAGPIDRLEDFYGRRAERFDGALFLSGCRRILLGYFKKLFLLGWLYTYTLADFSAGYLINPTLEADRGPPAGAAAFLALFFLRAYLDLSAYTDIAVGASACFGFRVTENFHLPFLQPDIGAFWRSWHVSLTRWCRDQIFFPVFALTRRPALATYASMLTMGLWHQISPGWAAWGAWHATGLVVHSQWSRRGPFSLGKLGIPLTWAFVTLGYAFVATPSPAQGLRLAAAAVGWRW